MSRETNTGAGMNQAAAGTETDAGVGAECGETGARTPTETENETEQN